MDPTARAAAPRRGMIASVWASMLLGALLFLPGMLGFFFDGVSFAAGTVLACAAALALAASGQIASTTRDAQGTLTAVAAVGFVVLVHLLFANAVNNDPRFDVGRAVLSLLLFGVILLSIPTVCDAIMASDGRATTGARVMTALFVISAVFSLLQIQPPTPSLGAKPTFPYTEPSFLGFSLPAILIMTSARSALLPRAGLILLFLVLGYALSNVTIVTACVLAATATLPLSWVASGAIAFVIGAASLDLSYYADRLDFDWVNSNNISSLVYVQGWQMLQEALNKTYGWGLGFQQLGVVYTNVPASIRLNALLGRDANLQDGGFILSKLGGEFGLLGAALIAIYVYVAARSFIKLRSAALGRSALSDGELFARSCVVGYTIEIIIRGSSYFTGTFVLMLAGLLYLRRARRARNVTDGADPWR